MKKVFADAGYWIALLSPNDQLHAKAKSAARTLGPVSILTSEMTLTEVLAFYADKGPFLREAAAQLVFALYSPSGVTVVPQTSMEFKEAAALYRDRSDKEWSLTDGASFRTMKREGISEALTHDAHFEQAGFIAILRSAPAA